MASSAEIGTLFFTIQLNNQLKGEVDKVVNDATKTHNTGEGKKQAAIKQTSKSVWNFTQDLTTSFFVIKGAAIGVTAVFNKMFSSLNEYANGLILASAVSRTSAKDIQMLSNQFSTLAGMSTEQAQSELTSLAKQIEKAKMGFTSPTELIIGGINFTGQTTLKSAINDLRTNLAKFSDAQASALLEQAGLSSNFLFLIRASADEFERFNQIPLLSEKQLQNIKKAGQSFTMLKQLIGGIIKTTQARIAPDLKIQFDKLFDVIARNKEKFIQFGVDIMKMLGTFIRSVTSVIGLLSRLTDSLFGSGKGLQYFLGILLAIKLATKPLWMGLTLLYLLLDDIAVWMEGGESAFGKFYDIINELPKPLKILAIAIAGLSALKLPSFLMSLLGGGVIKGGGFGSTIKGLLGISSAISLMATDLLLLKDLFSDSDFFGIKKFTQQMFDKANEGRYGVDAEEKRTEIVKQRMLANVVQPPAQLPMQNNTVPIPPMVEQQTKNQVANNTNNKAVSVADNSTTNIEFNSSENGSISPEEVKRILEEQRQKRLATLTGTYGNI